MIIDLDTHLREGWFLDKVYQLPPPYSEFNPVRIGEGKDYDSRFLLKWQRADGARGPGHDHGYMYDPRINWRGGELAARQVGGYDMATRIGHIGQEGGERQFLFPGNILGPRVEGGLGVALCQAYNNWAARLVKGYEDRLYPVAILPYASPLRAADEMARCVKDLGMKAVHLVELVGERHLDHPSFYPIYSLAEQLDVPLFCHPGGFGGSLSAHFPDNYLAIHAIDRPADASIALAGLVFGGIFEKFPRLRVCFFELGAEWIIYWMHRLEEDFEWYEDNQTRHLPVPLTLEPSDYVKRNVWITCEADEKRLPWAIEEIGADHICMATDYPHFDSTFPNTIRMIRERNDLSGKEKDLVLGESAAGLVRI